MTAKQMAEFNDKARALLARCGATLVEPNLGTSPEYQLETRAGRLRVTPYGDWCALRFAEVDRARADARIDGTGDLNPHSGKWNLQALDPVLTVAQRIELLEDRLRRVGALE